MGSQPMHATVNANRSVHGGGAAAARRRQLVYKQFRILRMVGEGGEELLVQEHEIRCTDHPACPLRKNAQ